MADYQPPSEPLIFGEIKETKKIDTSDQIRTFQFDPNRSDTELSMLNATNEIKDPQSGVIKFWSHSAKNDFMECPYRIKLKRIDKIRQESSEAAARGNLIHDQSEQYVDGRSDTLPDAKKVELFQHQFNILRDMYQAGIVQLEENWGFDSDWNPLPETDRSLYRNPKLWCITKLDVFIRHSASSAEIIDHKSGKKYGNWTKHSQQSLEYAISAFMRYPELEHIKTNMWYLDTGEEMPKTYTRQQAMILLPRVTERGLRLTTATTFPAKPNADNCRWCYYNESGDCEFAYGAI